MVAARDLAEAEAYQRRRVRGAFVHGGGTTSADQRRSGRFVVTGVALAVLLVGGSAAWASVTDRSPQVDWDQPGLVAAKETGQVYVVPGEGRAPWPAANVTSARLAVGDPSLRPVVVPDATIREHDPGPERGIRAAPPLPTDLDHLRADPWLACAREGRLRLSLGRGPSSGGGAARESPTFVVTTGPGRFHLLAEDGGETPVARAYDLPAGTPAADGARDDFLTRLGLPVGAQAAPVEPRFVELLDAGGDISLETLGVTAEDPGALLTDGGRTWLVADGRAVLMDDVALAVHRALTGQAPRRGLPSGGLAPPPWASAHWPRAVRAVPSATPCAVLRTGEHEPGVGLVADGREVDSPRGAVDAGDGAWVQRWQGRVVGPPLLVDGSGTAHPVPDEDDARALGLGGAEPVAVPPSWLSLLARGPTLSREAAVCPTRADTPCRPEQ